MPNQYFNQQQYNRATRHTLNQVIQKTVIITYEAIKFLAAFVKSMWSMASGK